jgi:hypothetical protein
MADSGSDDTAAWKRHAEFALWPRSTKRSLLQAANKASKSPSLSMDSESSMATADPQLDELRNDARNGDALRSSSRRRNSRMPDGDEDGF